MRSESDVTDPAPLVTAELGPRPAGPPDQCFYCRQQIGQPHKFGCVLWTRPVTVRAIVTYDVNVPVHWDEGDVLFHRNDGTWCSSNMIEELAELYPEDPETGESTGCLCEQVVFEVAAVGS